MTILASLIVMSAMFAQDVPLPPRVDSAGPDLSRALSSLKETLLSSGRVESSSTVGSNAARKTWQKITTVVPDSRTCQIRIHRDSSFNGGEAQDLATSYFFESVDSVEVLTQQKYHDQRRTRVGLSRSTTYIVMAYILVINGSGTDLLFADEGQATRAADAMRRAAQVCRSTPLTVNPAAGAPTLADTLRFIEDKLNDLGTVSYRRGNENAEGGFAGDPSSISFRITQAAADPSTCQVRLTERTTSGGNPISEYNYAISFRRVEKLDVLTEQEAINRLRGPTAARFKTEPIVYRLMLTFTGGDTERIQFRDEEMANRIAKAMTHAVELCGGGSKDPF